MTQFCAISQSDSSPIIQLKTNVEKAIDEKNFPSISGLHWLACFLDPLLKHSNLYQMDDRMKKDSLNLNCSKLMNSRLWIILAIMWKNLMLHPIRKMTFSHLFLIFVGSIPTMVWIMLDHLTMHNMSYSCTKQKRTGLQVTAIPFHFGNEAQQNSLCSVQVLKKYSQRKQPVLKANEILVKRVLFAQLVEPRCLLKNCLML